MQSIKSSMLETLAKRFEKLIKSYHFPVRRICVNLNPKRGTLSMTMKKLKKWIFSLIADKYDRSGRRATIPNAFIWEFIAFCCGLILVIDNIIICNRGMNS